MTMRFWAMTGALLLTGVLAHASALAQALPNFTITAPSADAVVDNPVVVEVALEHSVIGRPIDGLDHLHIAIDGGPEVAIYQGGPVTLPPLPAGPHVIEVELAGPSHRALLPRKHVNITVK